MALNLVHASELSPWLGPRTVAFAQAWTFRASRWGASVSEEANSSPVCPQGDLATLASALEKSHVFAALIQPLRAEVLSPIGLGDQFLHLIDRTVKKGDHQGLGQSVGF